MREKDNQTGKRILGSKHPVRQQLLAAFLGLCLIVVSMPVSRAGLSVQAAEPEEQLRRQATSEESGERTISEELRRQTEAGEQTVPQAPGDQLISDIGQDSGETVTSDDGKDDNEEKEFKADFYSGGAGNKQTITADMAEDGESGIVIAPELEELEGYTSLGWGRSRNVFEHEIAPGEAIAITGNTAYYAVYEKQVTLSYDVNGGDVDSCPESETKIQRAVVGEVDVAYDAPSFTAAASLTRTGYTFVGWNTEQDGSGEIFPAEESMEFGSDTALYAMWAAGNGTLYCVEHYKQDLEGDGYTRVDDDTEYLAGETDSIVEAEANPYTGYTLNTDPELGKTAGIVAADGSLVLRLYYDRNIYEVDFDLNGGEGIAPETQYVRYGALLQEVEEPQLAGYTFKGWYMQEEGEDAAYWDIYQTVEDNVKSQKITLYADWADETAPVLGEADFGTDYQSFTDWVISRKKLIITVPVTEEGDGLKQGDYRLVSEDGEVKVGTAVIRTQQALTPEINARSGGLSAVMTIRGSAQSGESVAVITITDNFKGSVYLTCTDNAENVSAEKILTVDGAGAVVEQNAPDIRFSKAKEYASKGEAAVRVDVTDSDGDRVSAGIAAISYKIDEQKVQAENKEAFADDMVENYSFEVTIKGEGKHILQVIATDNAGNRTVKKANVEIKGSTATVVPRTKTPTSAKTSTGGEPATGDNTFVKIFATLGMIAGFTYLLLYFAPGENGITEDEKEEIIARLVRWAQRGRFRKYPALVIILLFLVYYHSIGKSVSTEWRKVCES